MSTGEGERSEKKTAATTQILTGGHSRNAGQRSPVYKSRERLVATKQEELDNRGLQKSRIREARRAPCGLIALAVTIGTVSRRRVQERGERRGETESSS